MYCLCLWLLPPYYKVRTEHWQQGPFGPAKTKTFTNSSIMKNVCCPLLSIFKCGSHVLSSMLSFMVTISNPPPSLSSQQPKNCSLEFLWNHIFHPSQSKPWNTTQQLKGINSSKPLFWVNYSSYMVFWKRQNYRDREQIMIVKVGEMVQLWRRVIAGIVELVQVFCIIFVVVITWLFLHVKTHRTVHQKKY